MTALEIQDVRFQDPSGYWVSLWTVYHEGRVIRINWTTHLPHRIVNGEKVFDV